MRGIARCQLRPELARRGWLARRLCARAPGSTLYSVAAPEGGRCAATAISAAFAACCAAMPHASFLDSHSIAEFRADNTSPAAVPATSECRDANDAAASASLHDSSA